MREVSIGSVKIGGDNPVAVQSMTNTDTRDIEATCSQILELERAGCDIVRFSVYDGECAMAIPHIKSKTHIPLVADIHFDYKLAVLSAENGIDKLRINPGNIGAFSNVKTVADCAKAHNIPIRVGVNSGSVERDLLEKYGAPTAEALCESALRHVKLLEDAHFYDTVISIKASDVKTTVEACRRLSALCDYPLHIGVTESGLGDAGLIKSAIGIGSLLIDGIGATIRVSLTGSPVSEVNAARSILRALSMDKEGYYDIVSCPTCGRTTGDLEAVVLRVKNALSDIKPKRHIKIAVMGCVVNGPGEAKAADMGIAFAKGGAAVFKDGTIACSGEREDMIMRFIEDCRRLGE